MNLSEIKDSGNLIKKIVLGAALFIGALLVLVLLNPLVIVSAGERGVVLRFGAVQPYLLDEGIHFRIPLVDTVVKITVRIQKEEMVATAASKDLQVVTTKIALNYHIDPHAAHRLFQEIGTEYRTRVIDPAIQEAVKAVTARYTAEELITQRAKVKDDIRHALKDRLPAYHLLVDELSITDFDFSKEFSTAIEAKQTAEQLALKAKRDLDRIKIEAEQKVAQAKAEAEALRVQKQEITADLIKLREIEMQREAIKKWDGRLPQITGSAIPFINLERPDTAPAERRQERAPKR